MKKINIILIIALVSNGVLSVIFTGALPNTISKCVLLFYLWTLEVFMLLLLISTIIEIENLNNNEHQKTFAYFKDNSWQSYIYHTIIIVPLIGMVGLAIFVKITQTNIMPESILQFIYWVIAIENFIWFCWHLVKADSSIKVKKINLMLKLAVCIVSGVGFCMDVIARVNFTKQFIAMAWTVLLMSFISDKKNS